VTFRSCEVGFFCEPAIHILKLLTFNQCEVFLLYFIVWTCCYQMELELFNVMELPILTPGDRYLVVLCADSYDQSAAHYVQPYLTVLSLRSRTATCATFHAADLTCRGVPGIRRLLAVRRCHTNSYNVAVLYTNESDRVGSQCGSAGSGWRTVGGARTIVGYETEGRDTLIGGYQHNFGFLILDVCSGIICQVDSTCDGGIAIRRVCWSVRSFVNMCWGRLSRKRLEIEAQLQRSTCRKWHIANPVVTCFQ